MRLTITFINIVFHNLIFQIIEVQPSGRKNGENSCAPYPQNPITGFHGKNLFYDSYNPSHWPLNPF